MVLGDLGAEVLRVEEPAGAVADGELRPGRAEHRFRS